MAKKGKGEKGPAKDQFDPLLVESSQAATVILMLDSAEEEILLRSTGALYKFAHKCDENRMLLLYLGAIPPLMRHVQSENRGIHRNACMAIGTLSQHIEVGKVLKKCEETIPSMVRLLSPDEEPVVHEHALLCLSALAKYWNGINMIRQNGGLEAIIRCLSSPDADVKNKAILVVSLMLEEFPTRTIIRELNGLAPMLELLKEDYPEIQYQTLIALRKVSEEVANRKVLRDLGAMTQLVHFLGNHEYKEFHVLAMRILSNCFEDLETVKLIKENGDLTSLVAIATDAPPPKSDDKKGKKEKADKHARKSSAKKKSHGKGGDKSPRKSEVEDAPLIPSLPEVKESISWAIVRAARNAEIRRLLQEHEIEKMLILFLSHADVPVRIAASQAIRVMAENLVSRDCTGRWGGIPLLVKLTDEEYEDVKESAVTALNVLTTGNDFNCNEAAKCGGMESLLLLLSSLTDATISNALGTLVNMSRLTLLRRKILKRGLIPALTRPLSSQCTDVQAKAAEAVAAFILEKEHRQQFIEVNGVCPLLLLLDSADDRVRRGSIKAVTVLAKDTPTAEEICRLGGLDVLRELQTTEPMKSTLTEEAIVAILQNNLPAKYAIVGNLCPEDLITDGFYDTGKLRPGNCFLPLIEFYNQPMDGNRPIIVIYAPQEEPTEMTFDGYPPCPSDELQVKREQSDAEDETPPAITNHSCPPAPSCPPVRSVAHFQPDVDSCLDEFIKEFGKILLPISFCSTREQAIVLAKFVADKMGGPVEKGRLIDFSWELPLCQLKYQLRNNVVPLGMITRGVHLHRALLFKVLGDRFGIPSSLIRGGYNHAWNELFLEEKLTDYPKYPLRPYVIDLMHEPGQLMRTDSHEAVVYTTP